MELSTEEECGPEQLLKVLRFARTHYEWVVADLGAGLTPSALRLLGELDTLFVVSTAEVAALFQARRILGRLVTLGFPQERVRLVLNRLHKQQQVRPGEVEKALGWQIDAVLPNDLERIEEAQGEGRLLSPKSELGKCISELAARTLGQAPEEKPGFWTSVFRASQPREV
jgi:pilus assembly protein CpaE